MSPLAHWWELILDIAVTKRPFRLGDKRCYGLASLFPNAQVFLRSKMHSYLGDPAQEKQRCHFYQTSLSWLKPRHVAKHSL